MSGTIFSELERETDDVDAAYARLLEHGSCSERPLQLPGVGAGALEAAWRSEQAEPWWREIVARANADGILVHCYRGDDWDGYGEIRWACAYLLHPHTGVPAYETRDLKPPSWRRRDEPMIERWRRIARTPWRGSPPPEHDIDAEYARLQQEGSVVGPSFAYMRSSKPCAMPRWRAAERWKRKHAFPWAAALVARGRPDGLRICSAIEYLFHTTTVRVRSFLLDADTALPLKSPPNDQRVLGD